MGALTNYYVDPGAGNDWPGATFTDGSWDHATLTLTKTGAFTAANAKVGARLYLQDNGSGEVTPGYYVIASRTSDNAIVLASDIRSGPNNPTDVKCVQATGTTTGSPWASTQFALKKIAKSAGDGDRVNLKSGTADVLTAALSFADYGTPTLYSNEFQIEGYTSAQGDGGIGILDCNNGAHAAVTLLRMMTLKNLEIRNNSSGYIVVCSDYAAQVLNCQIHDCASGVNCSGDHTGVEGCYIYDCLGTAIALAASKNAYARGNKIENGPTNDLTTAISVGTTGTAERNLLILDSTSDGIVTGAAYCHVVHNSVYSAGGTGQGIVLNNTTLTRVENNIVSGFSGVGGIGIDGDATYDVPLMRGNAVYNCATKYDVGDRRITDQDNEDLSSDPFVDAAGGDLSPADVGNIRGGAWPNVTVDGTSWRLDKGAIQHSDPAGGGETAHVFLGP